MRRDEIGRAATGGPGPGDVRLGGGDERGVAGTSGGADGTSGGRFWIALTLAAAVVVGIDLVNVWTLLHEAAERGRLLPLWRPATDEFSSGAAALAAFPIVWLAARRWPARREGWPGRLGAHLLAATAFSATHVAGMTLIRAVAYGALVRHHAPPSLAEWAYEYPKDLMAYALLSTLTLSVRKSGGPSAAPPAPASEAASPAGSATFDIRDGARTLRTPVGEILAAVSAGNYVEFRLADGRAPLMRTTLAAVEGELAESGFVRVHRSWLVNADRVRVVEPLGSGDHRLTLEGGVEAPASRRYAEALAQLRSRS